MTITTTQKFDFDNDGILDPLQHGPFSETICDDNGQHCRHVDGYVLQPQLNTPFGIKPFQNAPSGLTALRGKLFAYVDQSNPKIRFYKPDSLSSFTNGQRVGFRDADGQLKMMRVDGYVIGIRATLAIPGLEPEYGPALNDRKQMLQLVYEQDPETKAILNQHEISNLEWVIVADHKLETIDPDSILTRGENKLSVAESLLKPLFNDAKNWGRSHPIRTGDHKKAAQLQLDKLKTQWVHNHMKTDPIRTQQIIEPHLWFGIQMALVKSMGLSPADLD